MKRIIILLGVIVCLTATHIVFAQGIEGVIAYEVKINMHRRIPPERAEMKARIPEFRTNKQELYFKNGTSLYKPVIEDEEEDMSSTNAGGGGRRFTMRFGNANAEIYLDQSTGKIITKQEFNGKEYLIEDSVKLAPWKFGADTKTILGYECKQAYYTDSTSQRQVMEITAWYTDKIRPFVGPEKFNTLPGGVLAVDINNGERVILAKKVELKTLKKNDIKVLATGTRITQVEFRTMVEEQMKKMGGGNGQIMIRN